MISDNIIIDNDYGVFLNRNCGNNIISDNIIRDDWTGIRAMKSSDNEILNNDMSDNWWNIGLLFSSNNNIISGNTISKCTYAVAGGEKSKNNVITDNEFYENYVFISLHHTTSGFLIHHNNFFEGTYFRLYCRDASGKNSWDDGEEGNYWDNYYGVDNDGDGIGDTPYEIYGYKAQDNYPFMTTPGVQSDPPKEPTGPYGPTDVKTEKEYTYTTNAIDPDEDKIKYCFDWGDGNITWSGYYSSGEFAEVSHIWKDKGSYEIKVKARDLYGYESKWSDTLIINVEEKVTSNRMFLKFFQQFPNVFPILRQLLGL
jgi:parallel beta-helix repeat protein